MHCGSESTVKNGHIGTKQYYKCKECGRQFVGGNRLNANQLWHEYVFGRQTIKDLATTNECSERTIRRKLAEVEVERHRVEPRNVILAIDTTYFGRGNGLMVFYDVCRNEVLLSYRVNYETTDLYVRGIEILQQRGFMVSGIVCDGHKGLLTALSDIPVQLCQFHQIQAVRRYLTRHPKLPAGKEILAITKDLTSLSKRSFTKRLSDWKTKWNAFLQEKTTLQGSNCQVYTHKHLRSAYNSLKRNTPWLFTFEKVVLPKTTSALEGLFAHLKRCLRNHNGLSDANKNKIILGFLEAWGSKKSDT